jgi:hypothetical protein
LSDARLRCPETNHRLPSSLNGHGPPSLEPIVSHKVT